VSVANDIGKLGLRVSMTTNLGTEELEQISDQRPEVNRVIKTSSDVCKFE